ncbi:hypothetical protein [Shewanella colwelliana]|uniref:hypothetical protein n=1 Tax=Shewanella colwelliana TaxID=23 RepID=UPI0022B0506F|nr:hypothetical protein [Shewanella colwelliana]MCZ4338521.1 hypothetical protein [Shewanella colwelliana]
MRHSSRQKHLKHVHRSAHIRRMCYFRTVQSLSLTNPPSITLNEKNLNPMSAIKDDYDVCK